MSFAWRDKPPFGTGVGPSALAAGLAFDFPFNEGDGATYRDVANGAAMTVDAPGTLSWGVGDDGPALVFAGGPHDAGRANSVPAFSDSDWSVHVRAMASASLASGQHALASRGPEGGVPGQFYLYFQNGVLTLDIPYVAGSVVSAAYSPAVGAWHDYVVTKSGTTYTLYIDGRAVASATYSAGSPVASGPLKLGTYDGSNCWPGSISRFRGWNVGQAASAVSLASGRPWADYLAPASRRFPPASATATAARPWWTYATQQVIGAPAHV